MGSSTVKAQREANAANIQMTHETNEYNKDIAAAQNDLNYRMFQEQNDWNLQRRDEEWAYNDPSAQVERLLKAGINPLWAMQSGDPGTAQPLTSASPSDAVGAVLQVPHVLPEYDPSRLGNIVAAANNVSNSMQGFIKLGLDAQDVETRRQAQQSQAALNLAETLFKRSQTAGQDILNNLNTRTFDTQVSTKVADYKRILSEISKTDSDTSLNKALEANARETKNQIIAQTRYVNNQADAIIDQVAQGWRRLGIEQQNADTQSFSARSMSYYEGENIKLHNKEYNLSLEKFRADVYLQSNEQIVRWISDQRGAWEKLSGASMYDGENINGAVLDKLRVAGHVLMERLEKDPSDNNVRSYQEYLDAVNSLPTAPSPLLKGNSQGFSILNPSASWQGQ